MPHVPPTSARATAAARIRVAEDAADALRRALAVAGVPLPSLRIDPVSCAREDPAPLVDLGRCTPDSALLLAAAVRPDSVDGAR